MLLLIKRTLPSSDISDIPPPPFQSEILNLSVTEIKKGELKSVVEKLREHQDRLQYPFIALQLQFSESPGIEELKEFCGALQALGPQIQSLDLQGYVVFNVVDERYQNLSWKEKSLEVFLETLKKLPLKQLILSKFNWIEDENEALKFFELIESQAKSLQVLKLDQCGLDDSSLPEDRQAVSLGVQKQLGKALQRCERLQQLSLCQGPVPSLHFVEQVKRWVEALPTLLKVDLSSGKVEGAKKLYTDITKILEAHQADTVSTMASPLVKLETPQAKKVKAIEAQQMGSEEEIPVSSDEDEEEKVFKMKGVKMFNGEFSKRLGEEKNLRVPSIEKENGSFEVADEKSLQAFCKESESADKLRPVESLRLSWNRLIRENEKCGDVLAKALSKKSSVRFLDLGSSRLHNLSERHFQALREMLIQCKSLQSLRLSMDQLIDLGDKRLKELCETLSQCSFFLSLDASPCNFGKSSEESSLEEGPPSKRRLFYTVLYKVLQLAGSRLQTLNLDSSLIPLQKEGWKILEMLDQCTALQTLDLSHNFLIAQTQPQKEWKAFCEMLSKRTQLQSLRLRSNGLGHLKREPEFWKIFCEALFQCKALHFLDISDNKLDEFYEAQLLFFFNGIATHLGSLKEIELQGNFTKRGKRVALEEPLSIFKAVSEPLSKLPNLRVKWREERRIELGEALLSNLKKSANKSSLHRNLEWNAFWGESPDQLCLDCDLEKLSPYDFQIVCQRLTQSNFSSLSLCDASFGILGGGNFESFWKAVSQGGRLHALDFRGGCGLSSLSIRRWDLLFEKLSKCPELQSLDFENANLSELSFETLSSFFKGVGRLPALQTLNLKKNGFSKLFKEHSPKDLERLVEPLSKRPHLKIMWGSDLHGLSLEQRLVLERIETSEVALWQQGKHKLHVKARKETDEPWTFSATAIKPSELQALTTELKRYQDEREYPAIYLQLQFAKAPETHELRPLCQVLEDLGSQIKALDLENNDFDFKESSSNKKTNRSKKWSEAAMNQWIETLKKLHLKQLNLSGMRWLENEKSALKFIELIETQAKHLEVLKLDRCDLDYHWLVLEKEETSLRLQDRLGKALKKCKILQELSVCEGQIPSPHFVRQVKGWVETLPVLLKMDLSPGKFKGTETLYAEISQILNANQSNRISKTPSKPNSQALLFSASLSSSELSSSEKSLREEEEVEWEWGDEESSSDEEYKTDDEESEEEKEGDIKPITPSHSRPPL